MSPLETLGFALGTSFASGLNLYLTVTAAGLFHRLGIIQLPEPLQILAHPVVLGIAGALVGLIVALAIVFGLNIWKFSFNFGQSTGLILTPGLNVTAILVACSMVIGVSLLASLQPAFKASRMEPIDALRHV